MAYAQQPRYGAHQRPQYEHQQASYASSHQAYAAEYDYEGENRVGNFNASSGREPSAQRPDQYPPHENIHNGVPGQANGGYEYEDPSYGPQNDWHPNQQYGYPDAEDNGYHIPQQNVGNQAPEYSDGYRTRAPIVDRNNTQPAPISKYDDSHAPRSTKGQSQGSSTRSESSHHSKPKKIPETPISPETLSWDNPFPTFPVRPKKGAHANSRSLDGSTAEQSNSRPQTANSKESSYTFTEGEAPVQAFAQPTDQDAGYFDHRPAPHVMTGQRRDVPSKSSEDKPTGGRVGQLKAPTVNGRHSEDNRARPFKPLDTTATSPNERSRTMPAAISEAVVDHNHQTSWQEPGPVAGYYGPEDREYLPLSPVGPPQQRPHAQSRAPLDDRRPYGHSASQDPAFASRQPQPPHDNLDELFDDYYDGTPQDHQHQNQRQGNQYRTPVDEDMPNFDVAPDSNSGHRRGMTIDDHLHPQQGKQVYSPMPAPSQDHRRRDRSDGPNINGQYPPRSRSQPNLKDKRSPRDQQGNGFDFGVPSAPDRPPASAPAWGWNSAGPHSPMGFPNGNPQRRGPPPPEKGYQGPNSPIDYPPNNRNRTAYPSQRIEPSSRAHHDNRPPDQYRSPPLRGGLPQPGQMRPPGSRPPPVDRNMANGAPPMGYQNGAPSDRFRSPPIRQNRSPQGQRRPSGGGPSPSYSTGPTSPPSEPLSNPDALPSHPAPFRPGLNGSGPSSQAPKPAPVRQYNAAPSPGQSSQAPQSADKKRESIPITHQELERVRQDAASKPGSLSAQLTLAKKLVEASSVLVDERADPRTRSKTRERYIVDAHRIVKRLSSNGYPEATFYLADAYSRGSLGLESDTREAFKLYQTAAKQNHAQAAYRVAVCCEIGQEEGGGTGRDPVKAMQWYKRAATLGDTPAMYKMGIISLKGLLGQPKNPKEALIWLKRAAERADRENPHALHEMALLHEKPSNSDGVAQDEAYSKQLFIQAANLGYKFSQFRMGCAYEYGLMGCPVDPRQSIAWYSKAAVQEEHQSELALSGWYLTGSEGVLQQSDTEAYLWARKAAQAGLAKAEYAMGYFTEVGIGAPANLEDAKRWYWRSASQNFPKARDRLEELRKGGATKQKTRVSRSNMKKQSDGECIVM
ncbi:uncharacterized protein P7C71_g3141, partial [Lecanoromycetidae sp. Uapishka_2]